MNTSTHRLIWSKSRGCIMAVAETASSSGKSASGSARPRSSRTCVKPLIQPFQASKASVVPELLAPVAINSVASCPTAHYLVETDPRFANYRQWLGSDFMLTALGYDPAAVQKRLGDGFYEQRLIREQVSELTGQRFLGNYTSDEQQYKGLMDAGITFAKSYRLRPGIALSAGQMALLTSDMVWLVEQTVTLLDGRTAQALVPQLYARVQPGDLDGTGTLLAGQSININFRGICKFQHTRGRLSLLATKACTRQSASPKLFL